MLVSSDHRGRCATPLNFARMLLVALALGAGGALAQSYPSKPVRLVVPFSAGGPTDTLGRLVGQKLSEFWGQQVIIDNRPGAGSTLGTEIVAKANPDGYTLLLTTKAHVINPSLYRNLSWDPIKDFAPVTVISSGSLMLVTNPSLSATTVKELIALGRANPGLLTYASSGNGGISHLAGHLFMTLTGIKVLHVPYKGMAPAVTDTIGGQVNMVFPDPLIAMPHVKSGKLRALGLTGAKRLPLNPEIPTIAEAGVPGYSVSIWYGVVAPGATPPSIVERLHTDIVRAVNLPDVRERLVREGAEPGGNTPQQFAALIKAGLEKWSKVVKESGVHLD